MVAGTSGGIYRLGVGCWGPGATSCWVWGHVGAEWDTKAVTRVSGCQIRAVAMYPCTVVGVG